MGHAPLPGKHFSAARVLRAKLDARVLDLPVALPDEHYVGDNLPVLDQGGAGSCWPVSVCRDIQVDFERQGIALPELPSPRAMYRWICETQGVIADQGSDPVIAWDTVAFRGFVKNKDWPYTDALGKLLEKTPADIDVAGWDQRDGDHVDYATVLEYSDGAQLEMIQRIVTSGRCVSICVEVDHSFTRGDFDPAKPLSPPSADIAGGHAMAIDGFKHVNGQLWFRVVNQWGIQFANAGRVWFAPEYVLASSGVEVVVHAEYFR